MLGAVGLVFVLSHDNHDDKGARVRKAEADTRTIIEAVRSFKTNYRRVPKDLQEILSLPDGAEPLLGKLPDDPWGTPYFYSLENGRALIRSAGQDRVLGTGDDVSNREEEDTPQR
jgi:type II secretory pathway pseudopilin PulG